MARTKPARGTPLQGLRSRSGGLLTGRVIKARRFDFARIKGLDPEVRNCRQILKKVYFFTDNQPTIPHASKVRNCRHF